MDDKDQKDDTVELEEDIAPEELELEEIEASSKDRLKKLKEKLNASEEERRKVLEDCQRLKADFLNARKRLEEQNERNKELAVSDFVERLMPLYDSFEMAMGNKEAWEAVDETWRRGVEAMHKELQSILASYNVRVISPVGESFDPNLHEAIGQEDVSDKSSHDTVTSVLQSGIVREIGGDTVVIRPARVRVGHYTGM